MFRPNRVHERFEKRDHIMLGDLFDFGNAGDVDLGLLPDFRRGSSRRLPGPLEGGTGLQLNFQPDLILVLEIPDGLHLGTGIPFNHQRSASLPDACLRTASAVSRSNLRLGRQAPCPESRSRTLTASSSPKLFASSMASFIVTFAGTSSNHSSSYGAKHAEYCDPRSACGSLSNWSHICRSAHRGPFYVPTRR